MKFMQHLHFSSSTNNQVPFLSRETHLLPSSGSACPFRVPTIPWSRDTAVNPADRQGEGQTPASTALPSPTARAPGAAGGTKRALTGRGSPRVGPARGCGPLATPPTGPAARCSHPGAAGEAEVAPAVPHVERDGRGGEVRPSLPRYRGRARPQPEA